METSDLRLVVENLKANVEEAEAELEIALTKFQGALDRIKVLEAEQKAMKLEIQSLRSQGIQQLFSARVVSTQPYKVNVSHKDEQSALRCNSFTCPKCRKDMSCAKTDRESCPLGHAWSRGSV